PIVLHVITSRRARIRDDRVRQRLSAAVRPPLLVVRRGGDRSARADGPPLRAAHARPRGAVRRRSADRRRAGDVVAVTSVLPVADSAPDTTPPRAGLCASCRHVEMITSSRQSTFYRCRRADDDPTFRKYPVLPVLACRGYEHGSSR